MRTLLFTNDYTHETHDEYRADFAEQGYTEEEIEDIIAYDIIEKERNNLANMLESIEGEESILCLGDLGLWNGRAYGYRTIARWADILDIACGHIEFYLENGCLRAKDSHHDGTNYYSFYIIKDENSEAFENLIDDIYNGKRITKSRLYYNCRSLGRELKRAFYLH